MSFLSKLFSKSEAIESKAIQAATLDARSLGFSRILFGVYFFAFAREQFGWIATVPEVLYQPPLLSLGSLVSGFPSPAVMNGIDLIIAIAALATTVGIFTRVSTTIWLVASIVGHSFLYSFGKIDHGIMLHATLLVMIVVNWGRCLSFDEMRRSKRGMASKQSVISLHMLTLLMAVGFFTAGLPKLLAWVDWDLSTSGFLAWLYRSHYTLNRQYLLSDLALAVRPLWVWEFADYTAVVFELGFLVARFNGRAWRLWILIAASFHLVNTLVLNIPFLIHVPVLLCFVDWHRAFPATTSFVYRWRSTVFTSLFVVIAAGLTLTSSAWTQGGFVSAVSGLDDQGRGYLIIALILWVITLAILGKELITWDSSVAGERTLEVNATD